MLASPYEVGDVFNRIVFLRRHSPDWHSLAVDFDGGHCVSPERYLPRQQVFGFPPNVADLVRKWNDTFRLSFFECRSVLKSIAAATLANVAGATVLDLSALPPGWMHEPDDLVFFVDDDDWFRPDTLATLTLEQPPPQVHAIVFPLLRLERDTFTFVPTGAEARVVVGTRQDFHFTFQTNNYGLNGRVWDPAALSHMADHVFGSRYFDEQRLTSCYVDHIVSVTNKTPASASLLPGVQDAAAFSEYIAGYIRNVRQLHLPSGFEWAYPSVQRTLSLFERVLASRRI